MTFSLRAVMSEMILTSWASTLLLSAWFATFCELGGTRLGVPVSVVQALAEGADPLRGRFRRGPTVWGPAEAGAARARVAMPATAAALSVAEDWHTRATKHAAGRHPDGRGRGVVVALVARVRRRARGSAVATAGRAGRSRHQAQRRPRDAQPDCLAPGQCERVRLHAVAEGHETVRLDGDPQPSAAAASSPATSAFPVAGDGHASRTNHSSRRRPGRAGRAAAPLQPQ